MAQLSGCQLLLAVLFVGVAVLVRMFLNSLAETVAVGIVNDSAFRADVYMDDGAFGRIVAMGVEPHGGAVVVDLRAGARLLATKHGVREGLFDLSRGEQHSFRVPLAPSSSSQRRAASTEKEGDSFVPPVSFRLPADAAPSPDPCQDRYPICASEAARGGCETNPGWMIVQCCESCKPHLDSARLIDPKIRCDRERLNLTEPAWGPGDLHDLFVSWATDPYYRPYIPTVLSSPDPDRYGGLVPSTPEDPNPPWVVTFDDFFSFYEAEVLVEAGQKIGFARSTDQGSVGASGEQEKIVSQTRTSSNAWCVGACEEIPQVVALTERIEAFTGIPRNNYESFQILEYEPRQFYRSHHDSSGGNDSAEGPRILTFFLYLSDVEEGGETLFNKLGISVRPKKGRALIWPSVLNEDPTKIDLRMNHEARPVLQGTKHAANHWIHLYDYVTPNLWGCTGAFA